MKKLERDSLVYGTKLRIKRGYDGAGTIVVFTDYGPLAPEKLEERLLISMKPDGQYYVAPASRFTVVKESLS